MSPALLLVLLACPARSADPPASPPPDPPPAASAPGEHPGTITFVDLDAGTSEARPASEVPEGIAWVTREGVRIPVVRIESTAVGGRREIHRYGPDGALLDSTVQAPRPPR